MHPQPLFHIGNQPIYLYGICMATGIILCFVFLLFTMWKKKFNEDASDKIVIIGVAGTSFGIFAAMLFQSLYNFIANPSAGFRLNGSMTFIGGLIGGVVSFLGLYWLYIYVIAPRTKIKLLQNNMNATLTDALPFIPIAICIAHAFGRLGCFFGGCCFGKPVDEIGGWGLPCASYIAGNAEQVYHYTDLQGIPHSISNWYGVLVAPTQLYEMFFLLVLGGVMAFLYFKFRFNYNFSVYLIAYGVWRFIIEFFRGDVRGSFLGTALYPSQIWSIVMVVLGVGYIFLQKYVLEKHMKNPDLATAVTEGESVQPAPSGDDGQ